MKRQRTISPWTPEPRKSLWQPSSMLTEVHNYTIHTVTCERTTILQLKTMTHSVARKQFVKALPKKERAALPKKHFTNATGDMKLCIIFT